MNNSVIVEVEINVLEVHGNLEILEQSTQNAEGVDAEETSSDESEGDVTECSSSPSVDAEEYEICDKVSSSKNSLEPLDAYETVEADDMEKSDDVAPTMGSPTKTRLVFQTIDVNGFLVHDTRADQVKRIFEKHPDLGSNFRPKNQKLRTAYVNVLLDLIEALCRSPQDITEEDLNEGSNTLIDLEDVGLKLDWLKAKFDEVRKRKEQAGGARIGKLEKELEKLKLMMSDLKAKLENEKEEVAAVRVPLSFNDIVS